MPTVREEPVKGWVHCVDPFCAGNQQREAALVRTTSDWSFFELGGQGSVPGTEKTAVQIKVADEADAVCPECSGPCEAADQKRPVYPSMISGLDGRNLDQRALLKLIQSGKIGGDQQGSQVSSDVADLRRELAELKAELSEQKAEPARRGRPPKPSTEQEQ